MNVYLFAMFDKLNGIVQFVRGERVSRVHVGLHDIYICNVVHHEYII